MPEDQRPVFQAILKRYKIDSPELLTLIQKAVEEDWTPTRFTEDILGSQTFRAAFPEYWGRIDRGLPTMTPEQILEYRSTAKWLMMNSGMPTGFYDQDADISDLIIKDVSPQELAGRVEQGFLRVARAPAEVKAVFDSFFGAQGESALAAFFLDPEKGSAALERAVVQAEIGGAGKRFGFDVQKSQAERLAELGVTSQRAGQGFAEAAELRPLATETITEEEDITEAGLVEAALVGTDREALRRRGQQRAAALGGGPGGAAPGRGGLGLGAAE